MDAIIIFGARRLTAVMLLIALVYFFKQSREKKIEMAVFATITLPLIYLTAKIASLFYYNPRPFVVGNFVPLIAHAPDNGFPSDHMLLSAAIAVVVYYYNKKVGVLLFVLAVLVGASRVLAGVHHVLDIAGSLVIASVVAFLVYKFVLPLALKNKLYQKLKQAAM